MSRILIAGAGYLGLALAERLRTDGLECFLARRSAVSVPGMTTLTCDFTDPLTLYSLPEVDVIYYAVSADSGSDEAYEKAYFIGLKNLIDRYHKQVPRPRFYLASTTSVYAVSQGETVTETDTKLETVTASRHMVAGERYLLNAGFHGAILRYGGIYGPERTSMLRRVRDQLEVLTPNAVQYMNRIHRDDAAGIVRFLMNQPAQSMEILNAVDEKPSKRDDVIRFVLERLGLKEEDYPKDLTQVPKPHKRVDSTKLQALGYTYIYPSFREGYAPLLAAL